MTVHGPTIRTLERVHVEIGATAMVVSGTAVYVGSECIPLSGTEARLLATLAARPNIAFSKEHLMRTVWDGAVGDPHTVEVAVARLRKRMGGRGGHGAAIRSVHRRGYTLRT